MHSSVRRLIVVAIPLLAGTLPVAHAKERASVTVSYVIAPPKPLPDGLKAVAVIDAGVKTEGAVEDEREAKWSSIAADMVEAMLQNATTQFGAGVAVARRDLTRQILEEQDLRLSGLVEGESATRAGKLLAVQGLITSRMTINIDVQKGTKSTLDWAGILGGVLQEMGSDGRDDRGPRRVRVYRQPQPRGVYGTGSRRDPRVLRDPRRDPRLADPRYVRDARGRIIVRDPRLVNPRTRLYDPAYRPTRNPRPEGGAFGGLTMATREVEEISRHLTVQCSFSLVDAVTGRTLLHYAPPAYQKTDSKSPDFLFGGMVDEADLDPVDHFIGELTERAAREFVSMLVPTPVEYTYELADSSSAGEAAIRSLRGDDFETAMKHWQTAMRKDSDEGEYYFAAGLTAELMGEPQRALDLYRQALSAEDVEKERMPVYMAAKQRLTEHLPRIVPPAALQNLPPAAPPSNSAGPSAPPGATAVAVPPVQPPPQPGQEPAASDAASPSRVQDEIEAMKRLEADEAARDDSAR